MPIIPDQKGLKWPKRAQNDQNGQKWPKVVKVVNAQVQSRNTSCITNDDDDDQVRMLRFCVLSTLGTWAYRHRRLEAYWVVFAQNVQVRKYMMHTKCIVVHH